jgi:hypothetical protein
MSYGESRKDGGAWERVACQLLRTFKGPANYASGVKTTLMAGLEGPL